MTEQQLLNIVSTYSSTALTVTAMGAPQHVETNSYGDQHYYVNIRKVDPSNTLVNYENIRYVVVNKGLTSETAYFFKSVNVQFENPGE